MNLSLLPLSPPLSLQGDRVAYSLRGDWFAASAPDKLLETELVADSAIDNYDLMPRLSVLFYRQRCLLTKSLTCSICGPSMLAYWSCSHPECHLSLCPGCHSTALYPGELSRNARKQNDGRLIAQSLCSAFPSPLGIKSP